MKIYIHYKTTEKPWGGGNTFLRAFKKYCLQNGVEIAKSINEDYDILFFSGFTKAPGKYFSINELINIKRFGYTNKLYKRFFNVKKKLLIFRADGFRDEYANFNDNIGDLIQKLSLHIADHVIFQNKKCLETANRNHIGYFKNNYSIIHNGTDQEIFYLKKENFWESKQPLKIFSANWSSNLNKGYKIIADFSELDGVESYFCGNWPKEVNKKKVMIKPAMKQNELADEYRKYDVFLHPSVKDMSPNVCLEAISCGLPVIYNSTSGIGEIIKSCGIEINDNDLEKTLKLIKTKYFELLQNIKKEYAYFSMERCAKEYIQVFKKTL